MRRRKRKQEDEEEDKEEERTRTRKRKKQEEDVEGAEEEVEVTRLPLKMSQFSELSLYKLYKLCLRLILHYLDPLINSADVPHQDLYFLCVKNVVSVCPRAYLHRER